MTRIIFSFLDSSFLHFVTDDYWLLRKVVTANDSKTLGHSNPVGLEIYSVTAFP